MVAAGEAGPRIAALVMAAGESKRFGSPKQVAVLEGEPLIRQTVRRVLASRVDEVVVVVGDAEPRIRAALAGLPVRFARNPDPAAGLGRSIAEGIDAVTAIAPPVDAVVVVLGDQPAQPSHLLDRLCEAFGEAPADVIALEYDGGVQAPPVLFARNQFDELRRLAGDRGARALVERAGGRVRLIRAGVPNPVDVDTVADLEAIERARTRPG